MHASHLLRAFAGVTVTFVAACSASTSGPDVETSSDALRTLSPTEIIGDLRYGQTSATVRYTETPKYRAFRFQGRAGDAVDAWVRSANGDARAWLLDASFANVVSNDDANPSTHDSHLVTKLTRDGAYYIAFREATLEDASFTVSLGGNVASPPACDPEEENCAPEPNSELSGRSIWDDAWTHVPAASQQQLLSFFAPGTPTHAFDSSAFASRYRRCNHQTGCGAWTLVDGIHVQTNDGRIVVAQRSIPMSLRTERSSVVVRCADVDLLPGAINGGVSRAKTLCAGGNLQVKTTFPDNGSWDSPNLDISFVATPGFVFGRSAIQPFEVGPDNHRGTNHSGNYVDVQYAFYARLTAGAPSPARDR